ncbi:YbgC/FadM family acyl-CoA thioesterase [Roseateles amylovorans]|jgi:YbgC/YbaW family acyl-CoA thioester hydrolase|uniref:YbgC/FadM family acyl-CoA thioesterase n=1 Tax=Roseateles amylovorans TaxID=2978473 RepID=A0ABY6AU59_9BURK|nr:YbgC/FadM family acyl-CoA thioesterase [Roseateles amylovorans]UXH76756.1 YbgC/FadM family acyl-CoA thioesterase [Roseateles amylovorans]
MSSDRQPPTRDRFRFFERLRVRWSEIDAQQIVFNGHYLTYFDTAVGGYWRALALPYAPTMQSLQGDLFVRKSTLEYLNAARYDELIDIGVRTDRVGTTSMTMACGVFRGDECLVHGELVYVFADAVTRVPKPVPEPLRDLLLSFERGELMTDARLGSWSELGADAQRIRQTVFVEEQKIPAEMEWDAADESCTHAVAYNRLGRPLATGRLLEHVPGVAKIGRMAVLSPMRGSRVGRQVLDALMQAGRAQGYREVLLHAQLSAEGFYTRSGFQRRGPVFEEAGIAHVEMVRTL